VQPIGIARRPQGMGFAEEYPGPMFWRSDGKMVRIAVFIDGGYFDEVSRYYKFGHERGSRLSVEGLLAFVRHTVADREQMDITRCQVVESHYFRGRFSAADAEAAGKLKDQAAFDEVLIRAGVVQHYLPVGTDARGRPRERGIDVWLSVEALDLAIHKGFDVLALVACDGDYLPLLRKLSGLGVRTLVLAWDFQYEYEHGGERKIRETRTAQVLLEACTYPVMMVPIIDDRSRRDDPLINGLFVGS